VGQSAFEKRAVGEGVARKGCNSLEKHVADYGPARHLPALMS
jgi:hypothetical protein